MPLSGGPISFRPRFLVGVVLAGSLLAFLPVVRNDLVNRDDPASGGSAPVAVVFGEGPVGAAPAGGS